MPWQWIAVEVTNDETNTQVRQRHDGEVMMAGSSRWLVQLAFAALLALAAGHGQLAAEEVAVPPPIAQDTPGDPAVQRPAENLPETRRALMSVETLQAELATIAADTARPAITSNELSQRRRDVEQVRSRAIAAQDELRTPLAERQRQLSTLGPDRQPKTRQLPASVPGSTSRSAGSTR